MTRGAVPRRQKDIAYDDSTIREWPPGRRIDADTREALEDSGYEPRTGPDGREVWIPKDPDEEGR
jgi:hypothetical protein